jgi:hypothetical protein
LAAGIAALGKKPAQGFGMVDRWEVEPWPEDWSEVGPEGRLMRAVYELPDGVLLGSAIPRIYGVRPPYWQKDNQERVWMPC